MRASTILGWRRGPQHEAPPASSRRSRPRRAGGPVRVPAPAPQTLKCRAGLSKLVDRAVEGNAKIPLEAGIERLLANDGVDFGPGDETPGLRHGHEVGDRPASDGDPQTLAAGHPPQDVRHVVAEVPLSKLVDRLIHATSVAWHSSDGSHTARWVTETWTTSE